MDKIDKKTYIGIVKFTLESMVDLAKSDKNYNLAADTIHYYETTIKPEMQISQDEFLELCKEAGIKQNRMKPSFLVEGVNNMNDVLEQRLAAKKRDLGNQQEYFKIDMKNIEQSNYEDNAINALLNMKKLKTEIAELELILQLQKANEL